MHAILIVAFEYVLMQCVFFFALFPPKLLCYFYIYFSLDLLSNQLVKFYLTSSIRTLVGILLII